MPFFSRYKCNICSFSEVVGHPESLYVTTDYGVRMPCPHPGENAFIAKILHVRESEIRRARNYSSSDFLLPFRKKRHQKIRDLIASRVGPISHCICDELHLFDLDYNKDKRKCPVCGSDKITRILDLQGRTCPKCHAGHIEEIPTGFIS